MPPVDLATDIFVVLFRSFCAANKIDFTESLLKGMKEILGPDVLPPTQQPPFVMVDEAQQAAEYLNALAQAPISPCSALFYNFLWDTRLFQGVVLAGTSLSTKMVRTVSSQSAQRQDHSQGPVFFVNLGRLEQTIRPI